MTKNNPQVEMGTNPKFGSNLRFDFQEIYKQTHVNDQNNPPSRDWCKNTLLRRLYILIFGREAEVIFKGPNR